MIHADQNIALTQSPWACWWEAFAEDARAQELERLEHGPAIACPSPAPGLSRLMFLSTLFQPQETVQ